MPPAPPLRELAALGVRTVLDDLGTGSSLAWLRQHPHRGIKIVRLLAPPVAAGELAALVR